MQQQFLCRKGGKGKKEKLIRRSKRTGEAGTVFGIEN